MRAGEEVEKSRKARKGKTGQLCERRGYGKTSRAQLGDPSLSKRQLRIHMNGMIPFGIAIW